MATPDLTDVAVEAPAPGQRLRQRVASGVLVNAGFDIGLACLSLLRPLVVVPFLSRADFGLWSLLVTALLALVWVKQAGIGDKFLQQHDADQKHAYQLAFTLELALSCLFFLLAAAVLPLFGLIYGHSRIFLPGVVLALAIPISALRSPTWVYYRRMDYARQRSLDAVDPVVGLLVTVGLAVAGLGYWALVLGVLAGTCAAAVVAVRAAPYPMALRWERGKLREYAGFSWPLIAASASAVVVTQTAVLLGNATVGLAGLGVIALANLFRNYTERVDGIVTSTLYPAICAVRERGDLLFESFVKSNRLALMWAMPFGIGLGLFAPELVRYVLGAHWRPAVGLLQVVGILAAVAHLGFNWTAYVRASGRTRPLAVVAACDTVAFVAAAIPLMLAYGLPGFGAALAVMTAVEMIGRTIVLGRLFHGFRMLTHAARAAGPTLPAVAAVLVMRGLEQPGGGLGMALSELLVYVAVTVVATLALERTLLREMIGYLRRRPVPA